MITVSETAKDNIKKREGFRRTPYDDGGVPAIAYGQRGFDPSIKSVTEAQGDKMLDNHLAKEVIAPINQRLKRSDLTREQQDVLIDVIYNMGAKKAHEKYNLFERINSGDDEDIINFLRTANKATKVDKKTGKLIMDPKTGKPKLFVLDGLTERANARAEAWRSGMGSKSNLISSLIATAEASDLTPEQFGPEQQGQPGQQPDMAQLMELADSESKVEAQDNLSDVQDIADINDAKQDQRASSLSDRLNISKEEASLDLEADGDENFVVMRRESKDLMEDFPAIYETSRKDPLTLAILRSDLEGAKGIEAAAKAAEVNPLSNAMDKAALEFEGLLTPLALETGTIDVKEAAKQFKDMRARRKVLNSYDPQVATDKINKVIEASKKDMLEAVDIAADSFEKLWSLRDEDITKAIPVFRELYKAGKITSKEAYDIMAAYAEYPELYVAQGIQSTSSTFANLLVQQGIGVAGGTLGGIAGTFTAGPVGTLAGAKLGYAYGVTVGNLGGALTLFSQRYSTLVEEEYDKYKGQKSYEAILTDPAFKTKVKKAATAYGVTGQALEMFGSKFAGKLFSSAGVKTAAKSLTKMTPKKAIIGSGVLALKGGKGAVKIAVAEGGQELGATTASLASVGDLNRETFAVAAVDSLMEAIVAPVAGGPLSLVQKAANSAVDYRKSKTRQKIERIKKTVDDSSQAVSNYDKLKELTAKVREFKGTKEFKNKTEEFVRETVNKAKEKKTEAAKQKAEQKLSKLDRTKLDDGKLDSPNETKTQEAKILEDLENELDDSVGIYAKEISGYLKVSGYDPDVFFKEMGEVVYQDYLASLEQGVEFKVPLEKWIVATVDNEVASAYVRVGTENNAFQADQILAEFESDPFSSFESDAQDLAAEREYDDLSKRAQELREAGVPIIPQPTPRPAPQQQSQEGSDGTVEEGAPQDEAEGTLPPEGEPGPEFEQAPEEEADPDRPILREIRMRTFLNEETEPAYNSLRKKMRKSMAKNPVINEFQKETLVNIQFEALNQRAEVLGKKVADLVNEIDFSKMTDEEAKPKIKGNSLTYVLGYFNPFIVSKSWKIVFRNQPYYQKDSNGNKVKIYSTVNTILHELGHSWLHQLGEDWDALHSMDPEKMTFQQKEYLYAMDEINNLMKEKGYRLDTLKDISSFRNQSGGLLDSKEFMRIHETWSQTTEKYFLEGEWENSRIKTALNTMRKWMAAIGESFVGTAYNNSSQYGPIYALPIDPKVNRIFQAIVGADVRVDRAMSPMLAAPSLDSNILGANTQKYMDLIANYNDKLLGDTYFKTYKKMVREQEAARRELEDGVRERAFDEVGSLKPIALSRTIEQAYEDFRIDLKEKKKKLLRNMDYAGVDKLEAKDPRISFESFAKVLFDGDLKKAMVAKQILPNHLISPAKKGGADIVEVMNSGGYKNPNEFLPALMEMAQEPEMMMVRAEQIYQELDPQFKTDEEIQEEAITVVQGMSKDQILKMELDTLGKKVIGMAKELGENPDTVARRMDKDAIEAESRTIIRSSKKKGYDPKSHLREANKANRLAWSRFNAADFLAAFKAKARQAAFFKAFQDGAKTKKKIQSIDSLIKTLKRTNRKKLAAIYDIEIIDFINTLVKAAEANPNDLPSFNPQGFYNQVMMNEGLIQAVNEIIEEVEIGTQGRSFDQLTVDSYLKFGRALEGLTKLARTVRAVEIDGKRYDTLETADTVSEEIGSSKKKKRKKLSRGPKGFIVGAQRAPRNVPSLLRGLYKSDKAWTESMLGKLVTDVLESGSEHQLAYKNSEQNIIKSFKKISKSKLSAKPITSKELDTTFEGGIPEIMFAIALMGSESGAEKLLLSNYNGKALGEWDFETNKVDESKMRAFIDRLIKEGTLTEAHFDAVESIWNEFGKYHTEVKNSIRYTDGDVIGTVEGRSFKTPWKTYQGGYVPIIMSRTSGGLSERIGASGFELDKSGFEASKFIPTQDTRFRYARTPVNKRDVLDLDISKVMYHLNNQIKVAKMRKVMSDFSKIIKTPQVKKSFDTKFEEDFYKDQLPEWFDRVLQQQFSQPSNKWIDRAAATLIRNTYIQFFFFAPKTIVKQQIGIVPAMRLVGPWRMASQYVKTLANFKKDKKNIVMRSARMEERFERHIENMIRQYTEIDVAENGWVAHVQNKSKSLAFTPIQISQNFVDVAIWTAANNKAINELDMSENDAKTYADDIVERTQGSTNVGMISNYQFGTPVMKLFSMIASIPVAQFNQLQEGREQNVDENLFVKGQFLFASMIYMGILPGLANQAANDLVDELTDALFGVEDEDEDESPNGRAKKMEKVAMKYATSAIKESVETTSPIGARFVMPLINRATDQWGTSPQLSPAIDNFVRNAGTVVSAADDAFNGIDLNGREWKSLFDTFTLMSGIPTSEVGQAINYYMESVSSVQQRNRRDIQRRNQQKLKRLRDQ